MSLRASLVLLLCCATLAACGDDDAGSAGSTVTVPAPAEVPDRATSTAAPPEETAPDATTVTPPTTTEAPAGDGECGEAAGLLVRVVLGDVACDAAREAVSAYDPAGEKVQEVPGFTCEGGEAAVLPLIVTCVSADVEVTGSTPDG